MNEEGRAYRDELTLKSLVRKFEDMVEQGDQAFFDVDELEGLIEHYLEHKSQRKAQSVLRYACQLYPGNLTLKLRQSQIWVAIGQPVKAVPLLKELLEIEPHSEEILITLGSVYSQMSEHKLAIDCFERALVFSDPETRREIRIDLALEFENMGAWKEAIRNLHDALLEDPANETAVYELAFCFERTGQFKRAAEFYEQFLEDQPYSFAAWYSLGNALQQCGRYPQAIEAYDFAIAIEGAFGPAYHQKAEALVSMERYHDALSTYEETLSFEDASPGPDATWESAWNELVIWHELKRITAKASNSTLNLPTLLLAWASLLICADNGGKHAPILSKHWKSSRIRRTTICFLLPRSKNSRNLIGQRSFTPKD